ncbi:MAG: PDZ domain-containing protein, partial [Pseudomonadota bacterium]
TDLDRYVFMAYALGQGYGGLEHRWSTSLEISRGDLPLAGAAHDARAWRKCLGLISHEYFHLWNVRRLKPAALTPMDLQRENHTGLLWVFEGITSYYDDLALARSGVISAQDYLELLGQTLTRVQRTPGRWRQSLEDSSFDAWTRFYKQDANAANAIISYYAKGAVAALALDLTLRGETSTTLDDVMRTCWQRYYVEDDGGMPERGLEVVTNDLAGKDLSEFFATWIRSTEDVDLTALLATMGIELHVRPPAPGDDAGGKPAAITATSWAGLRFDAREPGRIAAVLTGSPAERAGLAPGDVVVALGAHRFSKGSAESLLLRGQQGDTVNCHVFRGDALLEHTLVLMAPPQDTVWLTFSANAAPEVLERRADWLASNVG